MRTCWILIALAGFVVVQASLYDSVGFFGGEMNFKPRPFIEKLLAETKRETIRNTIDQSITHYQLEQKYHNRLINESEICPYHPYPYPLPNPLPLTLNETLELLPKVLQNVSQSQITPPPGIMFSVIYDEDIIFSAGLGSKNLSQPGIPPNLDTIFKIGSVTKLFPSVMTMMLHEQGIIQSLDEPLSKLAPGFSIRNPYSNTDQVTYRGVLSQLSGLPRQVPCETCFDCPYVSECNVTSEWIYNHTQYQVVVLPSYTRPSYSNLGFALLGRIPEPVIGKSFEDFCDSDIFAPLNMHSSGFTITPEVWEQMAQGYDFNLQPYTYYPSGGWENPAGGAYSSTRDMVNFLIPFIQSFEMVDSPILTATSMRMMLQPAFIDYDLQTLFSYPWESFYFDSYFVRCKAGNTDGFSAVVCVVPEMKLGWTVLVNADVDTFSYAVPVMEILVPAMRETLQIMPVKAPLPPNPEDYVGEFKSYPVPGPDTVKIYVYENERMVLQLKNFPVTNSTMVYLEDNVFQIIAPPTSPSRFMGSCQTIETSAFQYESLYFSPDKQYFHFGNGGEYKRVST